MIISVSICSHWAASSSVRPKQTGEVVYLDMRAALSFLCSASVMLVILFYFIDQLIYILIVFFALAGALSAAQIAYVLTRASCPSLDFDTNVRVLGSVNLLSCLYFALFSLVALWWAAARKQAYAFVLQDAMGVALLLTMQRTVRLPNIKISLILLSAAFIYDIYVRYSTWLDANLGSFHRFQHCLLSCFAQWVFLSPLLFGSSVMIKARFNFCSVLFDSIQIHAFRFLLVCAQPGRNRWILGRGDSNASQNAPVRRCAWRILSAWPRRHSAAGCVCLCRACAARRPLFLTSILCSQDFSSRLCIALI